MRLRVPSLALLSELRIGVAVNCGVGCRQGSDLALLWLWHEPVATAPIGSLAWEPPYEGCRSSPRNGKKTKKKKERERNLGHLVVLRIKLDQSNEHIFQTVANSTMSAFWSPSTHYFRAQKNKGRRSHHVTPWSRVLLFAELSPPERSNQIT